MCSQSGSAAGLARAVVDSTAVGSLESQGGKPGWKEGKKDGSTPGRRLRGPTWVTRVGESGAGLQQLQTQGLLGPSIHSHPSETKCI